MKNSETLCMGGPESATIELLVHVVDTSNAVPKGVMSGPGWNPMPGTSSPTFAYAQPSANGTTAVEGIAKAINTMNSVAKGGATVSHMHGKGTWLADITGYLCGGQGVSGKIDALSFSTDTTSMVAKGNILLNPTYPTCTSGTVGAP